ncbi:hypothetical protein G6F56_011738 [Rhizopus delemar]|nr:hypothetical protein G6F56_011738 [Rhizopus delemar]
MAHLLSSTAGVNPNANLGHSSQDQLSSTFFQEFEKLKSIVLQHENVIPDIQKLHATISELQDRNMALENENRRLRALLESRSSITEPSPTPRSDKRLVPVVATASHPRPTTTTTTNGADASVWATVARRAPKKKTSPKPRSVESAARAFQEPTGPSGFDYVYIPRSRRLTRKEVRTRLQAMKIDPYRVLDITFPARSVVGLLIHAQYKDTLLDRLAKANIRPRLDFDPCDPKYIADPKHEQKTLAERTTIALSAHSNRCLLGLERLRFPVAVAVGKAFVNMGYIGQEELDDLLAKSPDAPISHTQMFSSNEQDRMDVEDDHTEEML